MRFCPSTCRVRCELSEGTRGDERRVPFGVYSRFEYEGVGRDEALEAARPAVAVDLRDRSAWKQETEDGEKRTYIKNILVIPRRLKILRLPKLEHRVQHTARLVFTAVGLPGKRHIEHRGVVPLLAHANPLADPLALAPRRPQYRYIHILHPLFQIILPHRKPYQPRPMRSPPLRIRRVPHPRIAAPPQQPLLALRVPLRVVRPRLNVLHPVDRHRGRDVVVEERRAVRELRDHRAVRGVALVVGEELPVLDEVRGVLAGIHRCAVVVNEGARGRGGGLERRGGEVVRREPCRREGGAGGDPAFVFDGRGVVDVDDCGASEWGERG